MRLQAAFLAVTVLVNQCSPSGAQIATIATSNSHTCAIMIGTNGIRCWGINYYGEAGVGNTSPVTTFPSTDISTFGYPAKLLTVGRYYTCAVSTTGGIQCWGLNSQGQLGTGGTTNTNKPSGTPLTMPGGLPIIFASGSHLHTCVILSNNNLHCWGWNDCGQVGYGDRAPPVGTSSGYKYSVQSTPVLTNVLAVGTGYQHTCALTMSYTVRCWGSNGNGQIGLNSATPAVQLAISSDIATNARNLTVGVFHNCFISSVTGGARCWGSNEYGELGIGSSGTGNNVYAVPSTDLAVPGAAVAAVYPAVDSHTCKCRGFNV